MIYWIVRVRLNLVCSLETKSCLSCYPVRIFSIYYYQLDLVTPGSIPCEARLRKHIRQIPNFLKNPLGLPHIGHLLYALTLNLGSLIPFILRAFFANSSSLFKNQSLNGMPNSLRSSFPSSSVCAVVTIVILRPLILSILS